MVILKSIGSAASYVNFRFIHRMSVRVTLGFKCQMVWRVEFAPSNSSTKSVTPGTDPSCYLKLIQCVRLVRCSNLA
jgi:hypothetical protein